MPFEKFDPDRTGMGSLRATDRQTMSEYHSRTALNL